MVKSTTEPPPAPGTKVVALHPIDQRSPVGFLRTEVFFIVKKALDQSLLRNSLDALIRNHLPILGARLKPAHQKGGLEEYHYPEKFPDDATLFAWSTASIDTTLEESNLVPDTSKLEGAVTWGRSMSNHEVAWTPSDWPRQRQDDKPDTPLLLVHIVSYTNATILSLNIPHAVSDQKGLASMVEAWLMVAKGLEPPPFITLEPGALDGPSNLPKSELRRKGQYNLKTKAEYIRMVLGILPPLIKDREETNRLMFISASTVTHLRDKFNAELATKNGPDHHNLTNGDIVSSILAKLAYLYQKKTKTFTIAETVNARGRHPALPDDKHYLHNCPAYSGARFKMNRDTPLIDIALRHRASILETAKVSNIERSFAVTKKVFEGGYGFPMGEPGDRGYHVTNWSSAWHGVDFSPAVKTESKTTDSQEQNSGISNGTGGKATNEKLPMLVFGISAQRGQDIKRMRAVILYKGEGGYWADFSCSTRNMALVDDLLKRDPYLETL